MHICLIGDHPPVSTADPGRGGARSVPGQAAMELARQGHQVHWVSSTDIVKSYGDHMVLRTNPDDSFPATCRYVVPSQLYRLEDVLVLCVDRTIWQQQPLHTRLFTFLCLLHRELDWEVVHVWGTLPMVYLTVYTARFLGVPVVVSYGDALLSPEALHAFAGQWITRNRSTALVDNEADRQRLVAIGDAASARVRVMPPKQPKIATALADLYENLRCPATS